MPPYRNCIERRSKKYLPDRWNCKDYEVIPFHVLEKLKEEVRLEKESKKEKKTK